MRTPSKGRILPKISTMPRQQTEAAAVLDLYKLAIEKNRLQQELQDIELRRLQILSRLTVLEGQVDSLEAKAHQMRDSIPVDSLLPVDGSLPRARSKPYPAEEFDLLFLEY
ncbi:MAG: hypothetical protein KME15_08210 [Drouetiella hepatica Uher 2000/2452]|jgi:hypothetical protein|uniref:Gas vesicle protein n=1 Tax=Drouetiella hepatica Uher 2000/2452 TaxID=904376 RepID=A0A951ULZ2_9CYAN|nr:hypothetical protein [Drouetiella hepatica Uher 2000/2452]